MNSKDDSEYEEAVFVCEMCGKKVIRVKRKSNSQKTFLCQHCAKKIIQTE